MSKHKRITLAAVLAHPSDEAIKAQSQARYIAAASNPNCFSHWFPAVEALGIPTPKSDWIAVPAHIQNVILEENYEKAMLALTPIADRVRQFARVHGYPTFIKNSLFSAKHSWETSCFIQDSRVNVANRIASIFYEGFCLGVPVARFLVVRQFIETTPAFKAFDGMPITQEFRLFAKDGVTYGYQPYWPEMAVRMPTDGDWKKKLQAIATPSDHLLEIMTVYANRITGALSGDWSVDFLIDADGSPWLIDMALAAQSFKCNTGYIDFTNIEIS